MHHSRECAGTRGSDYGSVRAARAAPADEDGRGAARAATMSRTNVTDTTLDSITTNDRSPDINDYVFR